MSCARIIRLFNYLMHVHALIQAKGDIMAGRCWLESSLDRSSKLGFEVLQRAKRRSETWKSVGSSHRVGAGTEKHTEVQSVKTQVLLRHHLDVCCCQCAAQIFKNVDDQEEITNISVSLSV